MDRVSRASAGRAQGKPHREVQEEVTIGRDVQVDEWRETAIIGGRQSLLPGGVGQHFLQHQRVDVDHADLQQVQASMLTSWSSCRLLASSPPLPKRMNELALFQFSTTLSPSWISRRRASDCR